MNPVLLYFASGESLYAGAGLLLLTVIVSPLFRSGGCRLLRNVAAWLALLFMIMASPPLSWAINLGFLSAFVVWIIMVNNKLPGRLHSICRIAAVLTLAGFLLLVTVLELRYRAMPMITGPVSDHVVVIGDSISTGIGPRIASWPTLIQQTTRVTVKNLSLPGADLEEALKIAARLTPEDRVVLIEIGGNDLLSGVPSEVFVRRLEALLSEVSSSGRTVTMFELPLLPHWISYGQAQRRLALKYGVSLIPKRYFAEVLSGGNATLDGLHLSDVGNHRMAALVTRVFSNVFKDISLAPPSHG
jgi:acyl-CoA thioesterase-1